LSCGSANKIFKASSKSRNARACNNKNNRIREAVSFALTCGIICAPLPLMPMQRMKEFPAVLQELSVLQELQHPNIVKLRDCLLGSDKLTLVYEFVFADQNLQQYMVECNGKLASDLVMSYMCQLLTGLEYCHAQGLTHGSLKPQALLVSSNGQLKIANFGVAKAVSLSTACYKAPEMLLGVDTYTTAMDIWAVGTILAEMVSEQPLFPGDSEIDVLHKIFQVQMCVKTCNLLCRSFAVVL
jgi:serine/threonine protein kinase